MLAPPNNAGTKNVSTAPSLVSPNAVNTVQYPCFFPRSGVIYDHRLPYGSYAKYAGGCTESPTVVCITYAVRSPIFSVPTIVSYSIFPGPETFTPFESR